MFISKYCASGNDFLIYHTFKQADRSKLAIHLCNRNSGIGADGLIVLLPSQKCDLLWQFYNSDGSEASMCGNGTRAAAMYGYDNGLCDKALAIETGAGIIDVRITGRYATTRLGEPRFLQEGIERFGLCFDLIDTGVPHLCAESSDIMALDTPKLRTLREEFDANVNLLSPKEGLHVRTYERGVESETLACGTGMGAVFAMLHKRGGIGDKATLTPASGERLEFSMQEGSLYYKGAVSKVCDSVVDI